MIIPGQVCLRFRLLTTLAVLQISGCGPAPADSPERKANPALPDWAQQMRSESEQSNLQPAEHARRVEQSKSRAVALYPELGVAGSAVNREFVRRYKLYKTINPAFFAEPDWPTRLAAMLAQDIGLDPRK